MPNLFSRSLDDTAALPIAPQELTCSQLAHLVNDQQLRIDKLLKVPFVATTAQFVPFSAIKMSPITGDSGLFDQFRLGPVMLPINPRLALFTKPVTLAFKAS